MKLSVVVGTLNVGGVNIERLIKSVLCQDFEEKELVVVDGCSTDDTLDVLKKYECHNVKWISEPDNGLIDAYNKGVKIATGDFVGFMGGTDWFNPGVFTQIYNTYRESNADIIYGDCLIEQKDGSYLYRSSKDINLDSLYYASSAFCTAGTFARKEIYGLLDGVDLKIANDVYLWGMAYRRGYKFQYVQGENAIANFSYGGVSSTKEYPLWKDVRKARLMVIEGSEELKERWKPLLDKDYALKMGKLYKKALPNDEYLNLLYECIENNDNYVIWGCGQYGIDLASALKHNDKMVKYFVDCDNEKWGSKVNNIIVENPLRLREEKELMVIISASNFENEIYAQLKKIVLDSSITIDMISNILYKFYTKRGEAVLDEAYKRGIIS